MCIRDSSYAPGAEDGILIIQNYEDVTLKGSFSGLIIVHKTEVLKIKNNSETVSYTHLDVYKRQVHV